MFTRDAISRLLDLPSERFLDFALLAGNDYTKHLFKRCGVYVELGLANEPEARVFADQSLAFVLKHDDVLKRLQSVPRLGKEALDDAIEASRWVSVLFLFRYVSDTLDCVDCRGESCAVDEPRAQQRSRAHR